LCHKLRKLNNSTLRIRSYLGDAPTSMSLLKRSGLLMEAMHPIIPDMEWPTRTDDFKSSSSMRLIKSFAKASYDEYLTGSKRFGSFIAPEKIQSKTSTRQCLAKRGTILSHTDWSPPNPCARIMASLPEPVTLAFKAPERPFSGTTMM